MRVSARKLAISGLAAAVVALGALAYFSSSLYEVVDKGPGVRSYSPDAGSVYELKFFDTVTVYADEESRPNTDSISGSALVALATAALMTFLLLRAGGGDVRLRRFYGLAALGFGYLAMDEFIAVHETIGHNLPFLADLPGVHHPDDVIIALYLIPAVLFVVYFRDVLAGSARSRAFFAAAIALFGAASVADLAGVAVDELFEILSAGCIAGGFITLIAVHLTAFLGLSSAVPPGRND